MTVKRTSGHLKKHSQTTTTREGLCYKLAYEHILEQGEGTLIHVEVFSQKLGHMIDHALVETEMGFIYEPVIDRYFDKGWLYRTYKVNELARYTMKEALLMAIETGTYGPWKKD
ncbi:hypothetical protein MUP59_06830 [Candidatus Bathyarchaeota archaeon]|nr:hypothetical protein [Candidatus Bathyarchaeota archaeon]